MSQRKAERVWLQTPVDVPGLPGASTQFSPEKTPGVTMWLTELGLELSAVNHHTKATTKAFVPVANLKVVVFADESQP